MVLFAIVQYIATIFTNPHKITRPQCKVGSNLCLCHRTHLVSVTISVVSQMSSIVLFFMFVCSLISAEGPSPIVNKKISFNISCLSHLQVIEFDDGSGSVLRIQPLRTPRDEAIYECVASNSVGELSATTRLTVLRGRSFSATAPKENKHTHH